MTEPARMVTQDHAFKEARVIAIFVANVHLRPIAGSLNVHTPHLVPLLIIISPVPGLVVATDTYNIHTSAKAKSHVGNIYNMQNATYSS